MSRIKQNIVANYLGNGWGALLGFIATPLYVNFMGIEAYGLVGFFLSLQGLSNLLDFGINSTINREMARYSTHPEKASEARNLVRTLEVWYWGVGIVLGMGVFLAAPFIATQWVKAEQLSITVVEQTLRLMGLAMAFQWPLSFYQNGLMGLQKQVLLQKIFISTATIRQIGALLILWLVSPTIVHFFMWQVLMNIVKTIITVFNLWNNLPTGTTPTRFDINLIKKIWRYATGLSLTTFATLFLSQLDKVILSKVLSLEFFGYYALAGTVTASLSNIISPVYTAIFPQFSALVAKGNKKAIIDLYHSGCQLMSTLLLPITAILSLFSKELVFIWIGDEATAVQVAPIVSVAVIGVTMNGLMHLPHAIQLAYGWVSLGFYSNLVALLFAPLIYFMAITYGSVGAAMAWVIIYASYILFQLPFMHRRLLKGELRHWYLHDVGLPLIATLVVAGLGRILISSTLPLFQMLAGLAIVSGATVATSVLVVPLSRNWIFRLLKNLYTGIQHAIHSLSIQK